MSSDIKKIKFRELRKKLGMTQGQVAKLLEVSRRTVEAWEGKPREDGAKRNPPDMAIKFLERELMD